MTNLDVTILFFFIFDLGVVFQFWWFSKRIDGLKKGDME